MGSQLCKAVCKRQSEQGDALDGLSEKEFEEIKQDFLRRQAAWDATKRELDATKARVAKLLQRVQAKQTAPKDTMNGPNETEKDFLERHVINNEPARPADNEGLGLAELETKKQQAFVEVMDVWAIADAPQRQRAWKRLLRTPRQEHWAGPALGDRGIQVPPKPWWNHHRLAVNGFLRQGVPLGCATAGPTGMSGLFVRPIFVATGPRNPACTARHDGPPQAVQ